MKKEIKTFTWNEPIYEVYTHKGNKYLGTRRNLEEAKNLAEWHIKRKPQIKSIDVYKLMCEVGRR